MKKKIAAACAIAIYCLFGASTAWLHAYAASTPAPGIGAIANVAATDSAIHGPDTGMGVGLLAWSWATWARTTATTGNLILFGDYNPSYACDCFYLQPGTSGHIMFANLDATGCVNPGSCYLDEFTSSVTLNDGNWHLYEWSYTPGYSPALYVDGLLASRGSIYASNPIDMTASGGEADFGGIHSCGCDIFPGELAGCLFYTHDLSTAQLAELWNDGSNAGYFTTADYFFPEREFKFLDTPPPGTTPATDSSLAGINWTYGTGTQFVLMGTTGVEGAGAPSEGGTASCPSGESNGPLSNQCKYLIPPITLPTIDAIDCSGFSAGWDILADAEYIACEIEDFAIGIYNDGVGLANTVTGLLVGIANDFLDMLEPTGHILDPILTSVAGLNTKIPFAYTTSFIGDVVNAISTPASGSTTTTIGSGGSAFSVDWSTFGTGLPTYFTDILVAAVYSLAGGALFWMIYREIEKTT